MHDQDYPISVLKVEKSQSKLGNWVIKLSPVTFRFYQDKADAQRWLNLIGNLDTFHTRRENGE